MVTPILDDGTTSKKAIRPSAGCDSGQTLLVLYSHPNFVKQKNRRSGNSCDICQRPIASLNDINDEMLLAVAAVTVLVETT